MGILQVVIIRVPSRGSSGPMAVESFFVFGCFTLHRYPECTGERFKGTLGCRVEINKAYAKVATYHLFKAYSNFLFYFLLLNLR